MNFAAKLLGRFFGSGLVKNVELCNDVVAQNIFLLLAKKYSSQVDEETAHAIAAAMTNELFARPPGNEFGKKFFDEKRELVEAQLKKLKSEARIVEILNIIVHTRANILSGMGKVTPEIIQQTVRLKELGILSSGTETKLPTTPEQLVQKVKDFELWVANQK